MTRPTTPEQERAEFEAWREDRPWYIVSKAAADDEDNRHGRDACIHRMMNMAASDAWSESRAAIAAAQPHDISNSLAFICFCAHTGHDQALAKASSTASFPKPRPNPVMPRNFRAIQPRLGPELPRKNRIAVSLQMP